MSGEKILSEFSLDRVSLRAAHYNLPKLDWLNKHHIMHAAPARILELSGPFVKNFSSEFNTLSTERKLGLISAEKGNISRLDELDAGLAPFLHYSLEPEALAEMGSFAAADVAGALLKTCDTPDYETALNSVSSATGMKGKKLFMPVRAALLGRLKGPELKKIYEFLTPAERRSRIETFLRLLSGNPSTD
jgi:nondiscriminating glutamyl-tRNA synthetase